MRDLKRSPLAVGVEQHADLEFAEGTLGMARSRLGLQLHRNASPGGMPGTGERHVSQLDSSL